MGMSTILTREACDACALLFGERMSSREAGDDRRLEMEYSKTILEWITNTGMSTSLCSSIQRVCMSLKSRETGRACSLVPVTLKNRPQRTFLASSLTHVRLSVYCSEQ